MTAVLTTKLEDVNVKAEFEAIAKRAEKAGLSVEDFTRAVAKAGKEHVVLDQRGNLGYADQVRKQLEDSKKIRENLKASLLENFRNIGGGVVRDLSDLVQLNTAIKDTTKNTENMSAASLAFSKATLYVAGASIAWQIASKAIGTYSDLMSVVEVQTGTGKRATNDIADSIDKLTHTQVASWGRDVVYGLLGAGEAAAKVKEDLEWLKKFKGSVDPNSMEAAELYFKKVDESQKLAKDSAKAVASALADDKYKAQADRLRSQDEIQEAIYKRQQKIVALGKQEIDNSEKIKRLSSEVAILMERRTELASEEKEKRDELAAKSKEEAEKRTTELNTYWSTLQTRYQEEIKLRKQLIEDIDESAKKSKVNEGLQKELDLRARLSQNIEDFARKERNAELQRSNRNREDVEKDRATRLHESRMEKLQKEIEKHKQVAQEKEKADQAEKDRIAELKRLRDEAAQKELDHLQKVREQLKGQKDAIKENQQVSQQITQGPQKQQQNFGPSISGDQSQRFGPALGFNPLANFFGQQQQQGQQARGRIDRDVMRAAQQQNLEAMRKEVDGVAIAGALGKDDKLKELLDRKRFMARPALDNEPGLKAAADLRNQIKQRKRKIVGGLELKARKKFAKANAKLRKDARAGIPPAGAVKEVADAKQDKVLGAAKKRGAVNQQQIDLLKKLQALDQAEQAELDKVQTDLANVKAAIDALTNKQQQRVRKMR